MGEIVDKQALSCIAGSSINCFSICRGKFGNINQNYKCTFIWLNSISSTYFTVIPIKWTLYKVIHYNICNGKEKKETDKTLNVHL